MWLDVDRYCSKFRTRRAHHRQGRSDTSGGALSPLLSSSPSSPRHAELDPILEEGELGADAFFDSTWARQRAEGSETIAQIWRRMRLNIVHFVVEDWLLCALLGIITAILSIGVDVSIEYLLHFRVHLYERMLASDQLAASLQWVSWTVGFVAAASLFCHVVSKEANGSGIPEVKVVMHGVRLPNVLSLRTLIAKVVGLTLAMGGGFPTGKEGPFVHMGAIVASKLNKVSARWRHNAFFQNEGRANEMLGIGCAVGIACTFATPVGAVLYGIESTSRHFPLRHFSRSFLATLCATLCFVAAINFWLPAHIAGTLVAYYQTRFPEQVFVVEEVPVFLVLGLTCGLAAALFVWLNRIFNLFRQKNRVYKLIFGRSPIHFTLFFALAFSLLTLPHGVGIFIAGKFTFREVLIDALANCTVSIANTNVSHACSPDTLVRWTQSGLSLFSSFALYSAVYLLLLSMSVSLAVPAGIFVPAFAVGATLGRVFGEWMAIQFPDGIRGEHGPLIYPGLYALVGAVAFTGAVTHSLSVAIIACETTGQLSGLIPILLALMVANAIAAFLQPSIYDSTIRLKKYPYLPELPPSRVSVHSMRVEQVMVQNPLCVTRDMTYKQLRQLLFCEQGARLKSYPLVDRRDSMLLIGSVARRDLLLELFREVGDDHHENGDYQHQHSIGRLSRPILEVLGSSASFASAVDNQLRHSTPTGRLYQVEGEHRRSLVALRRRQHVPISLERTPIDAAPFQLTPSTTLYKAHTLFSLLELHHAYVTQCGRLVGIIGIGELSSAFSHIYLHGAFAPLRRLSSRQHRSERSPAHNQPKDEAAAAAAVRQASSNEEEGEMLEMRPASTMDRPSDAAPVVHKRSQTVGVSDPGAADDTRSL